MSKGKARRSCHERRQGKPRFFLRIQKGIPNMTKTSNDILLNTAETYRKLQPFQTVAELNANTAAIREQYADKMTPATYKVLDVLHRYACKYPGVCYRGKTKIAEELGLSKRTVIRACNALEALGVIVQYSTKRAGADRRQSTNAIVFVAVESSAVSPNVTPETAEMSPHDTPFKTPNKNIYTSVTGISKISRMEEVSNNNKPNPYDKRNLDTDRMPAGWYDEAAPYASDAVDLYAITGTLYKAKKGLTVRIEDHVAEFGEVLRGAWHKLKMGKVSASKWHAYLFTAFKRTAARLQNAEAIALRQAQIAEFFEPDYVPEETQTQRERSANFASMDALIALI